MHMRGPSHPHKYHLLNACLCQAIQSQSQHESQVRAAAALRLKGNQNYLCVLVYSSESSYLSLLLSCLVKLGLLQHSNSFSVALVLLLRNLLLALS